MLLQGKDHCKVFVRWLKAQRSMSSTTGNMDLWQIYQNQRADFWAGQALLEAPLQLQQRRKVLALSLKELQQARTIAASYVRAVMNRFSELQEP